MNEVIFEAPHGKWMRQTNMAAGTYAKHKHTKHTTPTEEKNNKIAAARETKEKNRPLYVPSCDILRFCSSLCFAVQWILFSIEPPFPRINFILFKRSPEIAWWWPYKIKGRLIQAEPTWKWLLVASCVACSCAALPSTKKYRKWNLRKDISYIITCTRTHSGWPLCCSNHCNSGRWRIGASVWWLAGVFMAHCAFHAQQPSTCGNNSHYKLIIEHSIFVYCVQAWIVF